MIPEDLYDLIRDALRNIQADVSDLKKIRREMREGFASVRLHFKTRFDPNDDPDTPR